LKPLHQLEDVVVTASRIETPAQQVASTVTVLSGKELRRKQYRLVVDALREVPGLDVKRNGGPGSNTSVFIRGADSDHTLVLIDGVEINDPSAPSRVPLISHLTTDNIDRVEILRGPQSTVWGGDAIGGVIHIITKSGAGPLSGSGWAEGGSYTTGRGGVDVSGKTGVVSYSLSASHSDTEGFSARSAGKERDGYRNTTASTRFTLDLGEAFDMDLVVRHTDAAIEFDGFTAERDNRIDVEQTIVTLQPTIRLFDDSWEQELSLRYARHERDTKSASPSLVEGELFGAGWRNDLRLVDGHTLTMGLEGEWEEADFPTFGDTARTFAAYVQDQIEWGQRVFGTAGVRVDDHDAFGTEVTYRLAAGYRIPETGTTFRSSFGTGFKAPSLSQLSPSAFGGNPDLHAEASRGLDLGVEQSLWGQRLKLGVTYFQNWIDDLIVAVFDSDAGAFRNVNVDEARTRGAETYFVLEPGASLTIHGSYTYTNTEAHGNPAGFGLEEGSRLLRRPEHKAQLQVHTRWLGGRGGSTLRLTWMGGRSDLDPTTFATVRADDYFVVDLSGSFGVTEHVRLFARVENLLDKDYEDVLGFATPGLSAYGGVELRY
jgi:vitamin B12 transporter